MRLSLLGLALMLFTDRLATAEDPPLAEYFRHETARIAARPLVGIESAEAWKASRPELQRQLLEMLGLWPIPEKTALNAKITRKIEKPDFVIENLVFESRPGLYVTGNVYRPKQVDTRLPAVLYVCGHAKVEKDGVIYGNKAHYQHHAAWYAANGYVCLVLDTLQLGELAGLHHGTYREGMWWWFSRGYTPAGVEAWNGVRAIDYLISRPEVDPERIGVTGRSGGGATSWWVGAIDDRVAAVIPVAGITDLQDHVVGGEFAGPYRNGVVEGHCDCMFFANTYRWDYDTLGALIAPRPLLIENTDADPIFPEGGVRRVFERLEKVYKWYDAEDRLGLVVGKGGHIDSPEIRHSSFVFMERWLKGKDVSLSAISEPDRRVPVEELKVLQAEEAPEDNQNAVIHEVFVPKADEPPLPGSAEEWAGLRESWLQSLRDKVFAGWPDPEISEAANTKVVADVTRDGVRLREQGEALAFVAVRGIGPSAWDHAQYVQIRRRFYLLGQTLDGMRVWDVRQALSSLAQLPELQESTISLRGTSATASLALWAAVFEPQVERVYLDDLPTKVDEGPAFLNLKRILDMPQAVALLHPREVHLRTDRPDAWTWTTKFGEMLEEGKPWPNMIDSRP